MQETSQKERVKKFGEVFTPDWMVRKMCDELEENSPSAFDIDSTFLEPTCGDGVFVEEILRRKFEKCTNREQYREALRSVYAMEIQADNVWKTIKRINTLCAEYFKPSKTELEIINNHVIQADSLKIMRMMNEMNEREKERGQSAVCA